MQRLLRLFLSHIRYKIIVPYLALMLLVTLAGAAIALALTAASWQERLTEQLKQIARNSSTALLQRERDHLAFLYLVALAQPNPEVGAPSMPDAFASGDPLTIKKAVAPLYDYQRQFKDTLDVDRFIAFDSTGKAFFDWERAPEGDAPPAEVAGTNLGALPDIQRVLRSTPSDRVDKYANLIELDANAEPYFYTVVPVVKNGKVLGGVFVGIKIDRMLKLFEKTSQSVVTNYYGNDGAPLGSSLLQRDGELPGFGMRQEILDRLKADKTGSVFDTVMLRGRNYEFAYSPLVVAQSQVGYFSVALSSDFQAESLSLSRNAVLVITFALALGAVIVGYLIARSITHPLGELVTTAEAVAGGDLERRTDIRSRDELGRLGVAFNQMTTHLLKLYTTSRDLTTKIDVDSVLAVSGETARSLLDGVEICALLHQHGAWAYRVPRGASAGLAQLASVELDDDAPLLLALADAHEPRLVAGDDPLLAACGLADIARFQHLLLTPLQLKDALVGVLIFGHQRPAAFTPAELPTLIATANMSASVLYNALLYTQTYEEANERKAILQSIADGVVVVDTDGVVVLANDAAQQILERDLAALIDVPFGSIEMEDAAPRQDMFGESRAVAGHYRMGLRTITLSRAPVIGEAGEQRGEVIVLHDITAEAQVDEAKTDFIATISHELRTPLTPIYSYIELLQRGIYGDMNDDQREVLGLIHGRTEQLRDLINNIVMVASIQSNTLATEPEPLDIGAVIDSTVAPLQRAIEKKGLKLTVEIAPELPQVLSDREQLRLIITQLVDNARRYTSAGGITIQAYQAEDQVQVDVADTGMGIPAERLGRMFTRFSRIEGNNSPERGSGLGLAITKQLIERQGGQVWVQSEVGAGSTFSFVLPLADRQIDAVAETEAKNAAA